MITQPGNSVSYAPIPMVPGPVTLHPRVLAALAKDYGSGQVERDFLPLYARTGGLLARLMGTRNEVALMTGEGMLALWGALKSCLSPGDAVVSVGTGVFGDGIGDMAASLGCRVEKISLPYNSTVGMEDSLERVEAAVRRLKPVMLTAVHCETPSGTLNPLEGLAELKKRLGVPLFYVDAVASLGGAPVDGDAHAVDLLLAGSQKCLAAPPSMSIIAVSETAWEHMARVNYQGYDAILPFRSVQADGRCPYTPYWHGVACLEAAASALLDEGMEAAFARHDAVARQCREGLARLGVALFPAPGAVCAPTVTAAMIPDGISWPQWQERLRRRGLIVAGSFGPMAGKVFRLGHMGTQADPVLMDRALAAVEDALLG